MEVVNTTSTTDPVNMYNYLNNYVLSPIVFIIILLIIVSYYVFSKSLNSNSSGLGNEDNSSIVHNTPKPENDTQFNYIENFASLCLQGDNLDQSFNQMHLNQEYKLSSDTEENVKGFTCLILSI